MPRIILGALLGFALTGALVRAMDQLLYSRFYDMHAPPALYYQLAMLTDTIFTFAGGWLCGFISRGNSQAAWGLIIMGELMGAAATVVLWNTAPHYYSFYLLIMYPPAVWYGAKSRGRITEPRQ